MTSAISPTPGGTSAIIATCSPVNTGAVVGAVVVGSVVGGGGVGATTWERNGRCAACSLQLKNTLIAPVHQRISQVANRKSANLSTIDIRSIRFNLCRPAP